MNVSVNQEETHFILDLKKLIAQTDILMERVNAIEKSNVYTCKCSPGIQFIDNVSFEKHIETKNHLKFENQQKDAQLEKMTTKCTILECERDMWKSLHTRFQKSHSTDIVDLMI